MAAVKSLHPALTIFKEMLTTSQAACQQSVKGLRCRNRTSPQAMALKATKAIRMQEMR
jgi:hypothetical protein